MSERGLSIDHTTLYRWVQHYAPLLKNKLEWYRKRYSNRWHIDETYIRVKGEWKYLYRAIDEQGNTLDFYLSKRRNTKATKLFLQKLIKQNKSCSPSVINIDKNPTYNQAINELKQQGLLSEKVKHLQVKYRNNHLESDHGKLKRVINPARGFQSMKTAYASINMEIMHMFRKEQFNCWMYGNRDEVKFINQLFHVYN